MVMCFLDKRMNKKISRIEPMPLTEDSEEEEKKTKVQDGKKFIFAKDVQVNNELKMMMPKKNWIHFLNQCHQEKLFKHQELCQKKKQ